MKVEDDVSVLESGHWRRLRGSGTSGSRPSALSATQASRFSTRGLHAPVDWLQPPSSAVTVAIRTKQFRDRDRDLHRVCLGRLNGMSSAFRTLGCSTPRTNAVAKASGSAIRVAMVRHDDGESFGRRPSMLSDSLLRVELGGILVVGDAPPVRLFGHPALVADVGVAAGGVHRRDDPARFRRRAIGHCQPRAGGPVLFNVFGRRFNAHVRQPGALKVEPAKLVAVYLELALIPSRRRLAAATRRILRAAYPGRQAPRLAATQLVSRGASGASTTRVSVSRLSRALIRRIMPSFRSA